MSSTKRRKKGPANSGSKAAASTNDTELNLGTCAPCKRAKSRCRFAQNATICKRCQSKGFTTECVIQPAKPRSRAAPGNIIDTVPSSKLKNQARGVDNGQSSSTLAKPATRKKRSNSESSSTSLATRPSKHPRLASCQTPLDSITEVNDEDESLADTLVPPVETAVFPVHDRKVSHMSKAQFMDAVVLDDHEDEEHEDSELEDQVSSSDENSSEDDEDIVLRPTIKPTKTQSFRSTKPLDIYDPTTC